LGGNVSSRGAARFFKYLIAVIALAAALASAMASTPVFAQDARWTVQPVEGVVRLRGADGIWIEVREPTQVAPGSEIMTGSNGRAIVAGLGDTITIAPNSRLEVPVRKKGEDAPNILQTLGTALYRMLTRVGGNEFEVQTPYLAAVIKGTTFAISVTPDGGALHVTEGLVQVTSRAGGQRALIAPGQTARVAARPGAGLEVHTPGKGRTTPRGNQASSDGPGQSGDKPESVSRKPSDAGKGLGPAVARASGNGQLKIKAVIDVGIGNVAKSTRGFLGRIDTGAKGPQGQAHASRGRGNAGGRSKTAPGAKVKAAIPGFASLSGTVINGIRGNAGGNSANAARATSNAGGNSANVARARSNAGGGNPNAGGGNPNAGGGNPNAGGGNPNAGGGNPNAGGGNANAGGGNANAGGGNANAGGGNANAGGGNANAGGGNANAGAGSANAGGGNPNAGGGNGNNGNNGNKGKK